MPRPTIKVKLQCFLCKKKFEILKWQFRNKEKRNTKSYFCSQRCKTTFQSMGGKNSHSWKGGRHKFPSAGGYVFLSIAPNKRVLEHRYIAEKKIGRKLLRSDVVHHINGKPWDNRPENLVVCKTAGEHRAKYHNRDGTLKNVRSN